MAFQWDQTKAQANFQKHGVHFADAVGVFEDPGALTLDDPHPAEERFVTVGRDFTDQVTVVNWTWRGDDIRPISARKASPGERRNYQEQNDDA